MGNAASGKPGSPKDDRYVTGDTNWESYELPQLIAMVTEKVDIPALVRLADDWRAAGDETAESADELAAALDELMNFWSGKAAEQARMDVALNAQWLLDLGNKAYTMGTPVEEAAGALKAAQDQMPQLPAVNPAVAPGSAPDAAMFGEAAGGPLAAAIAAAAAGSESAAQAAEDEAQLKRQAVETMRRFETAAMGIDQSIPQFEGPSPILRPRTDPVRTQPPVVPPPAGSTDPPPATWEDLTGQRGSGTSAQQHAGAGGGGAGVGWPTGVGGGAGGGSFAGGPALVPGGSGGRSSGPGASTGVAPHGERVPGMLPAASAGMLDADGHAGVGGAPMAGGMGAGAGGNKDDDHRRRFPFEADGPFAPDSKASPPVIGL
ncbi:MAG TPA: hypothetical protein VGX25_21050 [Actinophytocola sp.]|uniref:WXG100 family type VII secretion target n=1 Tax=Actinophytocola sp. TaxID=1872138 RepID=UPI002DDCA28F|nr:hypothetical protein [Actinophytocola sp.]HEV2781883.1 hypothetical protein [Actinophytocola sp.]